MCHMQERQLSLSWLCTYLFQRMSRCVAYKKDRACCFLFCLPSLNEFLSQIIVCAITS